MVCTLIAFDESGVDSFLKEQDIVLILVYNNLGFYIIEETADILVITLSVYRKSKQTVEENPIRLKMPIPIN